tara:strand:- start:1262 stop:1543 length:282 start_codon:yes stop_codon:yes gene_type:complete
MAFKMKGFSGFKTPDKKRVKTTKDIMSPEGREAVKRRQKSDSYNEPGGDPKEYIKRKKDSRQRFRSVYTVDPNTGIQSMNTVKPKVDYTKKFY